MGDPPALDPPALVPRMNMIMNTTKILMEMVWLTRRLATKMMPERLRRCTTGSAKQKMMLVGPEDLLGVSSRRKVLDQSTRRTERRVARKTESLVARRVQRRTERGAARKTERKEARRTKRKRSYF